MSRLDDGELLRIKAALNADPASALARLFPAGRLIRNEFCVGDITGTPGDSLKFNVKKLAGKEFSGSERGFNGVLDVYVAHAGSIRGGLDLARRLLDMPVPERPQQKKGTARDRKAGTSDDWEQIVPGPDGVVCPQFDRLWPKATFRAAWEYRDTTGRRLFYVARYEWDEVDKDGKRKLRKVTPAVTWGHGEDGRRRWRAKGNGLNILFGLEQLAARPDAPVLVVEGEKTACAARLLFPGWVVMAWKGGAGNARNIDVSPLAGRDVVLWPDADEDGGGTRAMEKIGKAALKTGAAVRLVSLPPGLADGWDLADAMPDGWTRATLESLLVNATDHGRGNRLSAYHSAPSEPRDAALARQRRTIGEWFGTGAKLVRARKEAEERAVAIIEEAGLNDDALKGDLTDRQIAARKAAISRKVNKQVAAEHGLERLSGKGARLLLTGSQGSGKSRAAAEEIADLDENMVVWWTVPTIDKAEEQAGEYRKLARPGSPAALVVRGRGQGDPEQPGKTMCPRHKVVNRAASRGVEVRRKICKVCQFKDQCGYLKQEAQIAGMEGGLFLMAREYTFMPSPAPKPDLFVGDESLIPVATSEPVTFNAERIRETGNWKSAGLDAAIDAAAVLSKVHYAATKHPTRILAALREAGIARRQIAETIVYLDEASGAAAADAITGNMTDAEIEDVLDQIDTNDIPNVIRLLRQIRREWDTGRDGLNTVTVSDGTVKVFGLRTPRIGRETPVLLLDGTGSATLNRLLFGDLAHQHIPVERQAHITGTKGKSYSRQSITGCDRNGEPMPSRVTDAERLRQEIAYVARRQNGPVFVCGTKGAEEILAPILPATARPGHFGAVRGINAWEECATAVVAGREQVSPQRLEDMSRSFTATDAEPFQVFGGYVKQSRARRMRSGEIQPVEVEVHPDPRCQELLEQIREAEIVQAADRVRPIFNERSIVLMNELVLDVTYDRILSHEELVMGGNRYERAWSEKGILPAGARDLHRLFGELWPTVKAAERDLEKRAVNTPPNQINTIWARGVLTRYRLQGQKGPLPSSAWIDPERHPDQRAALETLLGPLSHFEVIQSSVEKKANAPAMNSDLIKLQAPSRQVEVPVSELSTASLTVIPPRPTPTPADDLTRMEAILRQSGRVAGLSSRLEAAYQRLRPPIHELREQTQRRAAT